MLIIHLPPKALRIPPTVPFKYRLKNRSRYHSHLGLSNGRSVGRMVISSTRQVMMAPAIPVSLGTIFTTHMLCCYLFDLLTCLLFAYYIPTIKTYRLPPKSPANMDQRTGRGTIHISVVQSFDGRSWLVGRSDGRSFRLFVRLWLSIPLTLELFWRPI